jgi:hypothetical protein
MPKRATCISIDVSVYEQAKARELNVSQVCEDALRIATGNNNLPGAIEQARLEYEAKITALTAKVEMATAAQQKVLTEQEQNLKTFLDCGADGVSKSVLDNVIQLENWSKLTGKPAAELRALKMQAQLEYNRTARA